jgi:hypothetical protein
MGPSLSRRTLLAGAAAAALLGARATRAAAVEIPATRAGAQLSWILDQLTSGGKNLAPADITPRFSPVFLSGLPEAGIISTFASFGPVMTPATIARLEGGVTDQHAIALINTPTGYWRIRLQLEFVEPYRIDDFFLEQVTIVTPPERPRSWEGLQPHFKSIAPGSAFIAGEIVDGALSPIASYQPGTVYPIASSFKLFVLGTIATQVAAGEHAWSDTVTISDDLRSLPSGMLYYAPAGSTYPLEYVVERMIAESDNTATDHVIHTAGRREIEQALGNLGHAHPELMTPLMYTREWFAMRMRFDDKQMANYASASVSERRSILKETVAPLAATLLETDPWPGPAESDRIEWFACVNDLAQVMARLQTYATATPTAVIGNALSFSPGMLFDPEDWSYVGFKEGYETGLKAMNWLLQRRDGRWFTLIGLIHDLKQEINGPKLHTLMAAAAGLLARHDR